jgi:hypothetical protein
MPVSIKNILREEDIEGFIQLGAPADEYDSEAEELEVMLSKLGGMHSEEQIVEVLEDVWNEFFGPFNAEEIGKRRGAFRRVAHRLKAQR